MSHYTNLNEANLYKNVGALLDKYAKFTLGTTDMWEEFHAFIINEKNGSLKFYNGPSFSNNYTKPQFESASSKLTGVTFNTQQVSFKIGVYSVTEDQYRRLIYLLHPYEIQNLSFDFEPNWRYVVKLAKREDSTRYVIGHLDNHTDLYYTEMQLTFDIQGDAIALSRNSLSYTVNGVYHSGELISQSNRFDLQPITTGAIQHSDLRTPFTLGFALKNSDPTAWIRLKYEYITQDGSSINGDIFQIDLKNLNSSGSIEYIFEYNSQTGDVYLLQGDAKHVVTLLTLSNSGTRIIKSIQSRVFMLPGYIEDNYNFINNSDGGIHLILETNEGNLLNINEFDGYGLSIYARTNLI